MINSRVTKKRPLIDANAIQRPGFLRRQALTAVGVLSAAALLLASCGGTDSDASGDSPATTGSSSTPGEATVDTLRIAVDNLGDQTPDPHLARNNGAGYIVVHGIGENLARRDLDNNIVPNLAESWEISEDGRSWTFTLREGVKMHDGSTFTANDVKTAIDRIAGEDFTAGFTTFRAAIDSTTVHDPLHVTVTTKTPYATMLDDMPVPIPTDYYNEVGEEGFRAKPMSAGSFMFDSRRLNESMTFTRFDDFWDPDRLANFTTLEVIVIPDEVARVAAVQGGDVDAAAGITPRSARQLENSSEVRILKKESVGMEFIYFNDLPRSDRGDSPFHDRRVRRALSLAIDREALADTLYGDFATPAANYWFSATPGYDASLEPDPYDPDRARELLEEAGYTSISMEMVSRDVDSIAPEVQQLGQAIQSYWEEIGVSVTYTPYESSVWSAAVGAGDLPSGVNLSSFPGNLLLDPGTPSQIVFTSTGGAAKVSDPRLDEMVADLQTIVEPDARAEAALEITNYVTENVYALPLFEMDGAVAVGPNIAEWKQQTSFSTAGPWWYLRAR